MNEMRTSLKFDGTDAKAIFDFVGGRIEDQASLEIVFSKQGESLGQFFDARPLVNIKKVLQILGPTIHSSKIVELKYVSIYASTEGAEITLRWPV